MASRIQNPALHMHAAKEEGEREGEETSAPEMVPPLACGILNPVLRGHVVRVVYASWRKTCKSLRICGGSNIIL